MKIVILGAGQVGGTLAEHLVKENYDVTLVDLNAKRLQELQDRLDIETIKGSAARPDVLTNAGCKTADMLIAVTNSDEVNMLGCFIAHRLFRTPNKVARVRAQNYHKYPALFGNEAIPIDVLISPESLVKNHIEKLIQFPGAIDVFEFAGGLVQLVIANPKRACRFIGKTLTEFKNALKGIDLTITSLLRDGELVEIQPDTTLHLNDEVHFITAAAHTHHVLVNLGQYEHPCQRVMIGGAGNIGTLLATTLEEHYKLKIIDHNFLRGNALANQLKYTTVLHGDIGDRDLLVNENIDNTDCFIAVTNDDEANIMSSLQAKKLGAKHVMAIINRKAYVELIEGSSIDHAISPHLTTIGSILTKLRKGDMVTVHRLRGDDMEAIEVIIHGDEKTSKIVGRKKSELSLPAGCNIFVIVRNNNLIFVDENTVFQRRDHVILLLKEKRYLHQVEQLFQVKIDYF